MSNRRYTEEFKSAAVKQVAARGYKVREVCERLGISTKSMYVWLREAARKKEAQRLIGLIRQSQEESNGSYGSPRITRALRELGAKCSENRGARLMRKEGLRAKAGYKRPRYKAGRPAAVAVNRLQQNFEVEAPGKAWVTDITYIRTWERGGVFGSGN